MNRVALILTALCMVCSAGTCFANGGGPDAFGYQFVDNRGGDSASFAWIELCGDPNAISGPTGHNNVSCFSWGWNFPFYGTNYTSGCFSTNGLMTMLGANSSGANVCGLSGLEPPWPTLYPYWDDLRAAAVGGCVEAVGPWLRYRDFGSYLVLEWKRIQHNVNSNDRYSFEAILFPDGRIKFQYDMDWIAPDNPTSATIGVDAPGAGNGLEYVCDAVPASNIIGPGRAIWMYVPQPVGRCCYGTGLCANNTEPECVALAGTWTVGLTCAGNPCPQDTCLELPFTEDFRLGPVYVGESSLSLVPVVNITTVPLQVTAAVDMPFLFLPFSGPFPIAPGETLNVPLQYTSVAPGYVDGALILSAPGCRDAVAGVTVIGIPGLATPGSPVLVPGVGQGSVAIEIDVNGNDVDVEYLVAASTDGFATTQYVQPDGTLNSQEYWATIGEREEFLPEDVHDLTPGAELQVKVRARFLGRESDYGPISSMFVPVAPALPPPEGLVIQSQGTDIVLNWQPTTHDSSGSYPVVDARYEIWAAPDYNGPYLSVGVVDTPGVRLVNEATNHDRRFYKVVTSSFLGPLLPSLRLTIPSPGSIVTGDFIMAAVDRGAGSVDSSSAIFQIKPSGGSWSDADVSHMPQIAGVAIWSAIVNASAIPSGACSVRVVETGPFGTAVTGFGIRLDRPPLAQYTATFGPGTATLDGTLSTDAEGPVVPFVWTLPDGRHVWGPSVTIPVTAQDTIPVTLEVNDVAGSTGNIVYGCTSHYLSGSKCGCKKMVVYSNQFATIKGKGKSFTPYHAAINGNGQRLGRRTRSLPGTPNRPEGKLAAFNFEVKAEVYYRPSPGPEIVECTHYQNFQLDEKCAGVRLNPAILWGNLALAAWDHAIGGPTWGNDGYDNEAENSTRMHHEGGPGTAETDPAPEIDWIDSPSRFASMGLLALCGPQGIEFDAIFCAVVDGPLACCRCKFRVTWTITAAGEFNPAPSLDDSGPGLGCITGPGGGCNDCGAAH